VEAEWAALIQSQAEQTVPLIVVPDLSSSQLSFVPELSQCAEPKSPIGYGNWCKAGLSSKSSSQQSSQQSSRVTLPRLASPYGSSFSLAEAILAELPDAAEAAFYVGFTSGTTGTPKGIVRSHLSWVESFAASQQEFGTCAHDRILVPGALTHSLSLYAVLEGLNAGATVYLLPRFSAKGVLRLLATQSITVLTAVPTLLKAIAKLLLNKSIRCSNVRMVIAGGSKLEPSLRSELPLAFPAAEILEYFGALELSFISLASSRERVPLASVGRSFHGVEVSIRKQTEPGAAAIGEIGWIGVKSQLLSLGNLEPEQETNYRKLEGWATVGDLGWQDADGYLYVSGREQDMIISGGINVYPMEIETILRHLPEIAEVVVVGIPEPPNLKPSNLRAINSKATETEPSSSKLSSSKLPHQEISHRGQLICAAIQWTGEPLARAELLRYLRQYLPTTKCPRYFITVDQFPTTPSGKVMRSALKEQMMMQLMPQPLGSDRTSAEDVPGSGATPNHF
jgi:acyl-CoA synthetase (AMP-forming)/AMP-acid ligase II